MEIFIGIIIVVLLISFRLSFLKRIDNLELKLNKLIKQNKDKEKEDVVAQKTTTVEPPEIVKPIRTEQPKPLQPEVIKEPIVVKKIEQPVVKKSIPIPKPKRSFAAWEKFIGENLLNKIGIAILVLGIGYFVKFAIDKEWIDEIGRVAIGIFSGGILIGIAHRLRNTFRAFSSVLTGGGIVVLYFTIALGYIQYEIFNPTVAFILMLAITTFGALLSIAYNKVELAVIALLGGLATPILVSTGEGNYKVLFIYLILLNGGMLLVSYKKQWKLVNLLSFIGTVIMIGGWLFTLPSGVQSYNPLLALSFGGILFLEFFMMNVLRNLKLKIAFKAFDFSLLLSNTALFYSFGMIVLGAYHDGFLRGLFTVGLALFNFSLAYLLKKKSEIDKNIIYLLIGLVLTLVSLAAPIQLDGNLITLFWAAEMCLLLWLYQKSNLLLIKRASVIVFGATLVSLFMDWNSIYFGVSDMDTFINEGFITGLFVIAAFVFYRNLLSKETNDFFGINIEETLQIISGLGIVLGFVVGLLELNYSMSVYFTKPVLRDVFQGIYILGFLTSVLTIIRRKGDDNSKLIILPITILGIGLYIFNYQESISSIRYLTFVENKDYAWIFNMHYIGTLIFAFLLFEIYKLVNRNDNLKSIVGRFLLPFIAVTTVIIASQELNHLSIQIFYAGKDYANIITQTQKAGFALMWGVLAMIYMIVGIKKKEKTWRLISLSLLSITLLKLFIYDIRGISEGGKIAAFIGLGALLLIVSFMYQKVKDLILNDE